MSPLTLKYKSSLKAKIGSSDSKIKDANAVSDHLKRDQKAKKRIESVDGEESLSLMLDRSFGRRLCIFKIRKEGI